MDPVYHGRFGPKYREFDHLLTDSESPKPYQPKKKNTVKTPKEDWVPLNTDNEYKKKEEQKFERRKTYGD